MIYKNVNEYRKAVMGDKIVYDKVYKCVEQDVCSTCIGCAFHHKEELESICHEIRCDDFILKEIGKDELENAKPDLTRDDLSEALLHLETVKCNLKSLPTARISDIEHLCDRTLSTLSNAIAILNNSIY